MKKIFLTALVSLFLTSQVNAEGNNYNWQYRQYSGKIDNKYKIDMTIVLSDEPTLLKGYYSYNNSRKILELKGYNENDTITFDEYDEKDRKTGVFVGTFVGDTFKGNWSKPDLIKKIPFIVTRNYNNKTLVKDLKTKKSLIGVNNLSLQWVSWDTFGDLKIEEKDNKLIATGSQRFNSEKLDIDGFFTMVDKNKLSFNGKITTQVTYINKGIPCTREGDMTFLRYDNRNHWRLQEMLNPCDAVTDYVDISIRKK